MLKNFIKNNIILTTIILFLFIFMILISIKPSSIFNKDGSLKDFGLGYSNKTIIPLWLIVIIISILSYFALCYIFILNN